jgi:hypothetical protein
MSSWIRFFALACTAAVAAWASPSAALEKRAKRISDDRGDDWRGGSTCVARYYNICTGWVWVWSGFQDDVQYGVNFNSCCPSGQGSLLTRTDIFWGTGAPGGYGFTGTIDVFAADGNGCPSGAPLGSQAHLPVSPWSSIDFSGAPVSLPDSYVITYTNPVWDQNPTAIGSDHPAAGPTGPQSCGTCFQSDRTIHSFVYGTAASPTCPGSTFFDGFCNAELMWEAFTNCVSSVETSSWGQIKGLYR